MEFMLITTFPLITKFIGQLDRYPDDLMRVFCTKGGSARHKICTIMAQTIKQNDYIIFKRECVLMSRSVYLNEDMERVVKEYMDSKSAGAELGIAQKTRGIYVFLVEGAGPRDEPADVGVVLEGMDILQNLLSVTFGCVMLFGLVYVLN